MEPARAKPRIIRKEETRITVQISGGLVAEGVKDQKLADEARQRRHPGHGDGGGKVERRDQAGLGDGGRSLVQPGMGAAAGDKVGDKEQRGGREGGVQDVVERRGGGLRA